MSKINLNQNIKGGGLGGDGGGGVGSKMHFTHCMVDGLPNKDLAKCRFNDGPMSAMLAQHLPSLESGPRVFRLPDSDIIHYIE